MPDSDFLALSQLSDTEVLDRLGHLVRSSRRVTAELVAHLAEVEERRLHLKVGYGSLFAYCVGAHGMSEDEACRRIDVARIARKFPEICALLASGALSLTVTAELKHYLRADNASDLLQAMSGKSVQEARRELAAQFPRPDMPSTIRKLPERKTDSSVPEPRLANEEAKSRPEPPSASVMNGAQEIPPPQATASSAQTTTKAAQVKGCESALRRQCSRIEATARERYRVEFTAGAELKRKLDHARELMAHRNPSRDLALIVEPALDLLITALLKQRHGKTQRPATRNGSSERVTAATKREVSERDGYRCSYVDASARRCEARAFLEYDHIVPVGKGGSSHTDNVRLLCRAHNRLAGELVYGREKIEAEIAKRRRARSARTPRPARRRRGVPEEGRRRGVPEEGRR